MGKKINLIVNYRNSLGLYHLTVEQLTATSKNNFITVPEFAKWIAEIYMKQGCDHVICTEFKCDKITKASLKNLAEMDAKFITDSIRKSIGEKWEFFKDQKKVGD